MIPVSNAVLLTFIGLSISDYKLAECPS